MITRTWPHDGGPFIIYDDHERGRIVDMARGGDLAAERVVQNHVTAVAVMQELHGILIEYALDSWTGERKP